MTIQPRTLKGFRDYLPQAAGSREWLIEKAKGVFRSFGYLPIDTPALEYTEILLGKGGAESDKQLYRFEDHGGRDVGLRFDLTVPLARYAAQHIGKLGTPFKRYHVGPVWRGENTQRGRYREFLQCDFDTIGTESLVADIECALVIHALFEQLGQRVQIHINNRKLLSGLLEKLDLGAQTVPVLRALDKLAKIGPQKVAQELEAQAGASPRQAREVLALAELEGDDQEILAGLRPMLAGSELGEQGLSELEEVLAGALAGGLPPGRLVLDVSIARGLDYYTGTIFETFLDALPGIGSCCSGGRYDDLASLYTSQRLPGIGASLGVDRLLAALEELDALPAGGASAPIFLPLFDADRLADYLALAAELRGQGLGVELYPEARKLGAQLKYADRRGHRLAVVIGGREWEAGTCQLKDLRSGESSEVSLEDLAAECRRRLGRDS